MLAHLLDVRSAPLPDGAPGFTLSFHFSKDNPFFSNEVLTKTYRWADEDEDMLEAAEGTVIHWAPGKDPTMKVMKKKPKKGGKPLTKLEPCDSFFRFFTPPELPESADDLDEEAAEALQDEVEADFEIGATLREEVIPQAVAWFTGAAIQADDDEDDDEEGEEEDEEDDDDEDDDEGDESEEEAPRGKKAGGGAKKGGKGAGGGGGGAAGDNPECKQQ